MLRRPPMVLNLSSKAITKKKVAKADSPAGNVLQPDNMQEEEKFICEKCGEQFNSGWALGGHASRVHPGESAAYRNKIKRRDERQFERKLLSMAKDKHK